MEQQSVKDPVLGHRLSFERITGENGEEALRVEMWVNPGGGVPPHVHPAMEERFEVLAGTPEFLGGRKWKRAAPGEIAIVHPGTRHAYRNRGEEIAHVVCTATPPSSLQQFLEESAALSRAGKLAKHGIPRTPGGALDGIALAHRHREMVELGFPPLPPAFIQRVLLPPLARFAERRGHGPASLTQT